MSISYITAPTGNAMSIVVLSLMNSHLRRTIANIPTKSCNNSFFNSFDYGYKLSYTIHITIQAARFHCGIEVNRYSIYQLNEVVVASSLLLSLNTILDLDVYLYDTRKDIGITQRWGIRWSSARHIIFSLFLISG